MALKYRVSLLTVSVLLVLGISLLALKIQSKSFFIEYESDKHSEIPYSPSTTLDGQRSVALISGLTSGQSLVEGASPIPHFIEIGNVNVKDFLRRRKKNYDVVVLVNPINLSSDYFKQLTSKGRLIIAIAKGAGKDELKPEMLDKMLTALSEKKVQNPQNHLVIYESDSYSFLATHLQPIDENMLDVYYSWAAKRGARFLYSPYDTTNSEVEPFILKWQR